MTLFNTLKESLIEMGDIMDKEALELRISKLEELNEDLKQSVCILTRRHDVLFKHLELLTKALLTYSENRDRYEYMLKDINNKEG